MTPRQRSYFFGELWPAACIVQGWTDRPLAEREAHRREIVLRVAGCDSMAACTQDQLTAIFNEVRLLADPLDLKAARAVANPAQARHDDERTRLLYRILRSAPEKYIKAVARDKFREGNLSLLTNAELDQLRITLIERKRARNREPVAA